MCGELMTARPSEVRISPTRLRRAFSLLDSEVKNGTIPGAAALVGRHGRIAGSHVAGWAYVSEDRREAVQTDTIYDCASLTKVTVTLPLILMLLDQGVIHLDEAVADIIPAFATHDKSSVTLKQLLTHTSGLADHRKFYLHYRTPEQIRAAIYNEQLAYPPGTKMVYSDLGYIVLGEIVTRVLGCPLDKAAEEYLFQPLGMKDSWFRPPEKVRNRIAATEYRDWLGRHQRGEVHDENASALGGVSGHAGLFSTIHDLARYAAMWLAKGSWGGKVILSAATVEEATRCQTEGLRAKRGLGWVLKGDQWDASGDLFSPSTYGHTGFTGTSMWMDPERDLFVILLTNRVHYDRYQPIAKLRACFHNAVAASTY